MYAYVVRIDWTASSLVATFTSEKKCGGGGGGRGEDRCYSSHYRFIANSSTLRLSGYQAVCILRVEHLGGNEARYLDLSNAWNYRTLNRLRGASTISILAFGGETLLGFNHSKPTLHLLLFDTSTTASTYVRYLALPYVRTEIVYRITVHCLYREILFLSVL